MSSVSQVGGRISGSMAGVTAWSTVALLSLVYLCGTGDRIVLSLVLVPLQHDLRLTDTQAGLIIGAGFGLTYVAAGVPAGLLVDRLSRRALIIAALLFWSLMTFGCGLATGFVSLFAFRAGVGVGEAVQVPAASSLINSLFAPARRPIAFGAYLTAGALGLAASFLLGGALVAFLAHPSGPWLAWAGARPPWRTALMVSGLFGVLLAPMLLLIPRSVGRASSEADTAGAVAPAPSFMSFLRREPLPVLTLALAVPLLTTGGYAFTSWAPVYFARVYGWSPAHAAVLFAQTCGIAAFLGCIGAGWLPRLAARLGFRKPTVSAILACGLWTDLLGALAMRAPDARTSLAILTVSLLGLLTTSVLGLAYVAERAPANLRGRLTACMTVGLGLITNSLGPTAVGALTDHVFGSPRAIDRALLVVWLSSAALGMALILPDLLNRSPLSTRAHPSGTDPTPIKEV